MCENSQSSVDEAINNDDVLGGDVSSTIEQKGPVTLSKKAIHQQDADENLFLRFLELDPPAEAQPSPAQPSTSELRRKSTLKSKDNPSLKDQKEKEKEHPVATSSHNQNGRTPFTITKKLIRTVEKGFGFSIVWTHPPRIEKVEAGLSADRCGILPGDYVIFVDKHNVVTMPEMDILNLIKAQGNTLILEIFRRSVSNKPITNGVRSRAQSIAYSTPINLINTNQSTAAMNNNDDVCSLEFATPKQSTSSLAIRPMTACSNISLTLDSTTKQRLHLRPQVTFSKESMLTSSIEDAPRKYLYQLINREQHFITALQYGIQRFVAPLQERRDLISPTDQRTLFQNIEEILRLSEDILEQLLPDDREPNLLFASRVYLTKSTAFCAAYKKYCNGLKRADCVLVNKSRQSNSEFVTFITVPQVPRKRPDLTTLIHRPLQHFREVLKLIILLASHCRPSSEECSNLTMVIAALQTSYREITVSEGLMEPLGEGRPLLTLQDLEARLVFTKCKPFVLAVPGRQWVFGGDLSRVEGRSVKPYWTLLFSDILLFAKVSRDRVLFITEDPIPLANIIDSCFNIRKKHTEFRVTIDPNGRVAESPTINCAPDLTRTPGKSGRKHTLILRAPSLELKAVWQNLLQRQIFLVNATLGSTLSSPLESPDILQQFIPMNDIGAATTSMASIKLSADSINTKSQQSQVTNVTRPFEEFIDEKCRQLNKNGTSHGSALHLAQWMKGQFDDSIKKLTEENLNSDVMTEEENDELFVEWSSEQLRKRSQELQLLDGNGKYIVSDMENRLSNENINRNRLVIENNEKSILEVDNASGASTTSDSQITVRSSPVAKAIDKLSVCRHCHKNCKQKASKTSSLKVQHSQSSSSRCCASTTSSPGSERSTSSHKSNQSKDNQTEAISPSSRQRCDGSPSSQKTVTTTSCSNSNALNNNIMCKCKCTAADFQNTIRTSHEVRKETCKILNSVSEITQQNSNWKHANCYCSNEKITIALKIRESKISNLNEQEYIESTSEISNVDDWSSKLIGSSQFRPVPSAMQDECDPFKTVPKISVVPPTPDGNNVMGMAALKKPWAQFSSESKSPDSSPQEELPYRALNTALKRYGTMSSLEKMPSDETDDKIYDSSGTETNDDDDDEIRIVTKEVYDGTARNWTNRAGSFLEQSRAFLDSYLGRWDRNGLHHIHDEDKEDETGLAENAEECTSATSGEEIWGTPTSGENDEIQMFNSDQTSPTKSSSSLTGDDDTELMMDELLMAPPMTASTIRGLLPRRRLEPLFEEDTESSSTSDDNDGTMGGDLSSSDQGQAAQKTYTKRGPDAVANLDRIIQPIKSTHSNENITNCTSIDQQLPCTVEPLKRATNYGNNADEYFSRAPKTPQKVVDVEKRTKFVDIIDRVVESSNVTTTQIGHETPIAPTVYQTAIRLSPRLEMRLALNHDILGDEDLISFEPGPANLEAILGRDLSSYHRFTGKEMITRTPNHHRIAPKEAHISYLTQQKNSKMDTPTPNRKKSNPNTWNNSVCAAAAIEKKLSDLERLARAEKNQIQSKMVPVGHPFTNPSQIVTIASNVMKTETKSRGFFGFLKRRNSDTQGTSNGKINTKTTPMHTNTEKAAVLSQKDKDNYTMDRRFWKQLHKRRRSLPLNEITC